MDPHYLHERGGLEATVSPPVDEVGAVAWHPRREELLVATRDGRLVAVDPVMGTRELSDDLPEGGAIALDETGERAAVLGRDGRVQIWDLAERRCTAEATVDVLSGLWLAFWRGGVVVTGGGLDGPQLVVLDRSGRRRASGSLPPGVVAGVDTAGGIVLGRVTSSGPEIRPLARGRFDSRTPTSHRLRFGPSGQLFGVAEGGITVWGPDGSPVTVRCFGVSAVTLCPRSDDAGLVALGTRDGSVALARLERGSMDRGHPGKTGGHELAVRAVAFSHRGRWLASVGDRLWLWSY